MNSDRYDIRLRLCANAPVHTHRVVCDGVVIGHVLSDGTIDIAEPNPRQVSGHPMGGPPQT